MSGKIKIFTIVGARPQFIKASALSRAINHFNAKVSQPIIEEIMIHTGQHYDKNMSQVFFDELEITKPAFNLEIGSFSHGKQTGRMLEKIEGKIFEIKPDICVVYGDTNSTLAGALAASKLHIPVAHVEAGLRSFNRIMPEETNRVLTDHLSDMLFCPTKTAVINLKKEGIEQGVKNVGDVMIDCLKFYTKKAKPLEQSLFAKLKITPGQYLLATIHRAENTDIQDNITEIFGGLNEICNSDNPVILPLHPRTKKYLKDYRIDVSHNVKIIEPVSYLQMLLLEKNAKLILTDSGGIQKEAYHFSVPCITLRRETEWVETVECGINKLAGPDKAAIVKYADSVLQPHLQQKMFYGDGLAAQKIIDIIVNFVG